MVEIGSIVPEQRETTCGTLLAAQVVLNEARLAITALRLAIRAVVELETPEVAELMFWTNAFAS